MKTTDYLIYLDFFFKKGGGKKSVSNGWQVDSGSCSAYIYSRVDRNNAWENILPWNQKLEKMNIDVVYSELWIESERVCAECKLDRRWGQRSVQDQISQWWQSLCSMFACDSPRTQMATSSSRLQFHSSMEIIIKVVQAPLNRDGLVSHLMEGGDLSSSHNTH